MPRSQQTRRATRQLGKLARDHVVRKRQSGVRVAKRAAMMAGRHAHAKQFKRRNGQIRFLRTRRGRLILKWSRKLLRKIIAALPAATMPQSTFKPAS